MIIAFQIVLLIFMLFSFFGAIGENSAGLRSNMFYICIFSILAFLVTVIWL